MVLVTLWRSTLAQYFGGCKLLDIIPHKDMRYRLKYSVAGKLIDTVCVSAGMFSQTA